ncbi:MAG: GNAT family N-acetyltransferase, partial [Thermomicrobiales bacterium]|nr:GNAT family N-acetyltransferase [Thermomicrobiales bacterium]
RGDLVRINELDPDPPPGPAPRVYLGVTTTGIVRAWRHDVPAEMRTAIDRLCDDYPVALENLEAFVSRLEQTLSRHDVRHTPGQIRTGPAFTFPDPLADSAGASLMQPGQEALLAATFPITATWLRESWPFSAMLVDGRAVSLCYSARRTSHVAEAGVVTAPEYRGRGYAAPAVAAWAQAIRAAGITPVYSTSADNHASRAVARKLGLREIGWDVQVE